jgi:hypothetical protein
MPRLLTRKPSESKPCRLNFSVRPPPPDAALAAVTFSAIVGLIFGFFLAWRAAELDPIVALHSE